eukprot:scaffold21867_cov86-Isochrysis_galbana.AAC.3
MGMGPPLGQMKSRFVSSGWVLTISSASASHERAQMRCGSTRGLKQVDAMAGHSTSHPGLLVMVLPRLVRGRVSSSACVMLEG